jgi:hypothetical protein
MRDAIEKYPVQNFEPDRLAVVQLVEWVYKKYSRPLAQFELSPSPPALLPNLGEGSHKRYEDRGSA